VVNENKIVSSILRSLAIYGSAVVLALGVISIFVAVLGYNVFEALYTLLTTSFRSSFGFSETVKKAIPLLFATYAFTIPFMIKFFNIGGWGQMLFGGTMTVVVGLTLAPLGLPAIIMVPLLLIVGIVFGGLFGLLAGFLKAKYDINPIISTIMLNFIAYQFVNFIATSNAFGDPNEGHPITLKLSESSLIGYFGEIPASVILAFLAIVFVYFVMKKTKLGFEITAVGHNLVSAQTYGIDFKKTIMIAFFIGGALAGLGGSLEMMNIHGKLIEGFAKTSGAQYGVFGILTSLVVAGNPLAVPIAAFFMSVLLVGADSLQRTMQVPVEIVFLSQAIIVMFIVIIREKFGKGNK
jgi:general nucleoside transport system permease protein